MLLIRSCRWGKNVVGNIRWLKLKTNWKSQSAKLGQGFNHCSKFFILNPFFFLARVNLKSKCLNFPAKKDIFQIPSAVPSLVGKHMSKSVREYRHFGWWYGAQGRRRGSLLSAQLEVIQSSVSQSQMETITYASGSLFLLSLILVKRKISSAKSHFSH